MTWDGMGLVLGMYERGNRSEAVRMAGEEFLVVLPMLGEEPFVVFNLRLYFLIVEVVDFA